MFYPWVILACFCRFAVGDVLITFDAATAVLPAEDPVGALNELFQEAVFAGSCNTFEMLETSADDHIDGLLKLVDSYGLILGTEEVELIKSTGCNGGAMVDVADSKGRFLL